MAKLNRLTAKIFGETASTVNIPKEIGQFGSAKAGTYNATGDVATIQSLPAWSNGWIDAVTSTDQFPPLPEMTGVHKVLSYQNAYLLQQGIPEWDSGTTYYTNNFCAKNGKIYLSIVDENINNDPETDGNIHWEEFVGGGSSRNIGEIVSSTLPLTDAGLHLLDGALISGSGSYSDFVDYIADLYNNYPEKSYQVNANLYGALVNNNGVLSGFSSTNYAKLPKIFNPSNNPFEIVLKVKTPSTFTGSEWILGGGVTSGADFQGLTIGIDATGAPKLYLSSNGTSWDIASGSVGSVTLNADTEYYFKLEFTGTQYNLLTSTNQQSWTPQISITSSSSIFASSQPFCLGGSFFTAYNPEYYLGSIDLSESYINIDNERWWIGAEEMPAMFCTEELWQSSVTTYGVCGKFVYDSVNNTVRLPKITGFIEGTTDVTALGDLVEAGLPNVIQYIGRTEWVSSIPPDAIISSPYADNSFDNIPYTGDSTGYISIDLSRGNPIYGRSNTVQPQTIKVLYYIVIATTTKTNIQVDIDEIATDLNGKADIDLTNCTNIANIKMAHNAMPSDTYDDLTPGASGATYTAPADGIFFAKANSPLGYVGFYSTNLIRGILYSYVPNTTDGYGCYPVRKGDQVAIYFSPSLAILRFVYAQGSESEAQ